MSLCGSYFTSDGQYVVIARVKCIHLHNCQGNINYSNPKNMWQHTSFVIWAAALSLSSQLSPAYLHSYALEDQAHSRSTVGRRRYTTQTRRGRPNKTARALNRNRRDDDDDDDDDYGVEYDDDTNDDSTDDYYYFQKGRDKNNAKSNDRRKDDKNDKEDEKVDDEREKSWISNIGWNNNGKNNGKQNNGKQNGGKNNGKGKHKGQTPAPSPFPTVFDETTTTTTSTSTVVLTTTTEPQALDDQSTSSTVPVTFWENPSSTVASDTTTDAMISTELWDESTASLLESTIAPSRKPSLRPTTKPTVKPSTKPTDSPSKKPSMRPTVSPTDRPTDVSLNAICLLPICVQILFRSGRTERLNPHIFCWNNYFAQSPTVTPTFSPSEQPTPLQYCPDTYDPLFTGYVAGDRIEAEKGIYECLPEPYEKYCSIVAFDSSLLEEDENAKDLWSNCWQFVVNCYR